MYVGLLNHIHVLFVLLKGGQLKHCDFVRQKTTKKKKKREREAKHTSKQPSAVAETLYADVVTKFYSLIPVS